MQREGCFCPFALARAAFDGAIRPQDGHQIRESYQKPKRQEPLAKLQSCALCDSLYLYATRSSSPPPWSCTPSLISQLQSSMPKKIKTPPPGDDEPKYLAVYQPYPLNAHFDLPADCHRFASWFACCVGAEDLLKFLAFFYKPKVRVQRTAAVFVDI